MQPVLIYLRPLDVRTQQRVDIRVADGPNADAFGVGGTAWDPAILTRPKLSIELMSPDMDGKVQAGQAAFELALRDLSVAGDVFDLYWKGASVVIHSTGALEGATATPDFWGYITSATLNLDTGRMSVTAEVSTAFIDKPLLTKEFTGAGGINGDAAKRGVLQPAGFGTVKNIQPVWFDLTRNIGMIDGYANCVSIDWLGEGLSSFGARVADYATYALLAAAIDSKAIKPGQWGTCVAQGLVGLGAPPTGVITVHAVFGTNRIGALMKRVILTHAAVNPFYVDALAFDLLDALVDKPVHYWTDQQRNVKDLLEALAQSCNATPIVSFQNLITVTRAIGGTIAGTLDRSGSVDPRVIDWQFADVDPPYYLIKGRAARPASVLSDDQVNYVDKLEDVGVYNAATIYSAGNLVWLADGSQWLYQNSTPSAGHAPPVSTPPDVDGNVQDAWWFRRQPPTLAVNVKYADGTPLEALKPGEAGANVTESRTAAAITSQGPGATAAAAQVLNNLSEGLVLRIAVPGGGAASGGSAQPGAIKIRLPVAFTATMLRFTVEIFEFNGENSATYDVGGYNYPVGDQWLSTFASMVGADAQRRTVRFGKDSGGYACIWIGESGGTWGYPQVRIKDFVAGYSNFTEAAWATGWVVSFDTSAATNVTATITSPHAGEARYGVNILESSGVAALLAAFKTILGTAAGFTGQGALATINQVGDGNLMTSLANRVAPSAADSNYLAAGRIAWSSGSTVEALKPGEAGANITETRTAAAITGQGPGATATAAQVLNNVSESNLLRINAPVGGSYGYAGGNITGYVKIRLPVGFTGTMLRFRVEIYEYGSQAGAVYEIGGYNYDVGNTWLNCFAQMVGSDDRRRTVRFGYDAGGYASIYIGEIGTVWSYPQVRISNFIAGYSNFAEATWASGWVVNVDAVGPSNVSTSITAPNAGEARYGVNVLESAGVPATLANFKTSSGTAAAIAGQGALATAPALNNSNVLSYFNVNTFSLNYTIKRQDGSTTVTESLAITSLGISAGFTGQGSMATQNASGVAITGGSLNIANKFIVASDGSVTIRAATTGERTEINTLGLRCYDTAGDWTVKVGDLS